MYIIYYIIYYMYINIFLSFAEYILFTLDEDFYYC